MTLDPQNNICDRSETDRTREFPGLTGKRYKVDHQAIWIDDSNATFPDSQFAKSRGTYPHYSHSRINGEQSQLFPTLLSDDLTGSWAPVGVAV